MNQRDLPAARSTVAIGICVDSPHICSSRTPLIPVAPFSASFQNLQCLGRLYQFGIVIRDFSWPKRPLRVVKGIARRVNQKLSFPPNQNEDISAKLFPKPVCFICNDHVLSTEAFIVELFGGLLGDLALRGSLGLDLTSVNELYLSRMRFIHGNTTLIEDSMRRP